jgi:hypothetical protein
MVSVKQLLHGKKYNFKHLTIEILEKNEKDKVLAFSAIYLNNSPDGRLSEGLREANQLWDSGSGKRPPGYIVFCAYEGKDGLAKSVMISEEFYQENRKKLDDYKSNGLTGGY